MKKRLLTLLAAGALAFGALTSTAFAQGAAPSHGDAMKMEARRRPTRRRPRRRSVLPPRPRPTRHRPQRRPPRPQAADAPKPPNINKGDTAFMYVATIMVILMTIPGLALFYGGLVRSKNMLSVLMQVFVVFALITRALGDLRLLGGLHGRLAVLRRPVEAVPVGRDAGFRGATFSKDTYIPELIVRRVPVHVRGHHLRR